MTTQIFKTVLAGMLAGIALFIFPFFLLRAILFFCLIGLIVRLVGGRKRFHFRDKHYAFIHQYDQMSDEEKAAYKAKYANRCGHYSQQENSSINSLP